MDYTIKQGDNLNTIAKNNNTDVATLARLNNIQNPNLIQTGTVLKLPTITPLNNQMPTSTNVNANILGNTQPINLPQLQTNITPVIPVSLADQAIQQITQAEQTAAQKNQENLINKQIQTILDMNTLGSESQIRQQELNNLGYTQKLQDYQNLQSQISQKQAELNQSEIQLANELRSQERKDTLLPFAQIGQAKIQGDAAIMKALKTAEIGILNAQVLAKQGDIQLAKDTAQQAVDTKFAPYKAQIQTYTDILKSLEPILTRDEKKQANEQSIRSQIVIKEIDKLSKFQSDALSAAISNNAPQSVLNAINNAKSISDISKVGSQWIISKADKLEQELKKLQISRNYADINRVNMPQTIKGVDMSGSNTIKEDALTSAMELKKLVSGDIGFSSAVGAKGFTSLYGILSSPMAGSEASNFLSNYENLKALLSLENIKYMKGQGQISDGERKTLEQASSQLNTNLSEEQFKKILDKTITTLQGSQNMGTNSYLDTIDNIFSAGQSLDNYINSLSIKK